MTIDPTELPSRVLLPPHDGVLCYACGRPMRGEKIQATSAFGQLVYVGRDCYGKISMWGKAGYQAQRNGPRLWAVHHKRPEFV